MLLMGFITLPIMGSGLIPIDILPVFKSPAVQALTFYGGMSANNIAKACKRYAENGICLAGFVVNLRSNDADIAPIQRFADAIGTKILAEKDPVKKRADIVDGQIDTVGRVFLGLSLGATSAARSLRGTPLRIPNQEHNPLETLHLGRS